MNKILVVGDSMLDRRLDCAVKRLSPEGYVPVHSIEHEQCYAGGAANVALNIKAMGGHVTLLTALGPSTDLQRILVDADLDYVTIGGVDHTTEKRRYYAGGVVRHRADFDHVLNDQEANAILNKYLGMVNLYDVVVFSDYGKGALMQAEPMLEAVRLRGHHTIVDPKGKDWSAYEGATIIKCNEHEFNAVADQYNTMAHMLECLAIRDLICTCGERGAWHATRQGSAMVMPHPVAAVDPTGAGDSYLAALATWADMDCALRRASIAGALATTHRGTAVITREEILNAEAAA